MKPQRAFVGFLALVATLIWTGGCESTDDIITSTGTLRVSVVDRDLAPQSEAFTDPSNPPGRQVMIWDIESADLVIPTVDPGTFPYVLATPCTHSQLKPGLIQVVDCGLAPGLFFKGVGYAMDPDVPIQVSMRLVVSRIRIRRADRPLLLPNLDRDGDRVLNETDNCVLIPNPDQEDVNGDGVGDACSLPGPSGDPTIPDIDGDRVERTDDDTCVWIADPSNEDSDDDGIGNACQQNAEVIGAPFELELGPIELTIEGRTQTYVSADFNDQTALSCDPAFTTCTLDPGAVLFTSP